jgi:NADPH-dependent 7-cyano-7-deazaguanine reductase QueF-like protein
MNINKHMNKQSLKFYLEKFNDLNINKIYDNLIKKFGQDLSNCFLDLHNILKLK